MNCRYCETVYDSTDRRCSGCGAPKTVLSRTLLDGPATPDHWSNSFPKSVLYILIASAVIAVLCGLMAWIGWQGAAAVMGLFWSSLMAPAVLTYAAWRSAEGSWAQFFVRLCLSGMIWGGIMMIFVIIIGVIVAPGI